MRAGDQTVLATAGAFVVVPSGVVHGFANRSAAPVRFVFIHAPGGYEELFRELQPLRRSDGSVDIHAGLSLSAKYHDRIVGPPLGMDR
jgi:uncharacterized RmlC-like cupin family protein